MKFVQYAPGILLAMILASLVLLALGLMRPAGAGGALAGAVPPEPVRFEVHTVRVITRNDAIGTRDDGIDSPVAPVALSGS